MNMGKMKSECSWIRHFRSLVTSLSSISSKATIFRICRTKALKWKTQATHRLKISAIFPITPQITWPWPANQVTKFWTTDRRILVPRAIQKSRRSFKVIRFPNKWTIACQIWCRAPFLFLCSTNINIRCIRPWRGTARIVSNHLEELKIFRAPKVPRMGHMEQIMQMVWQRIIQWAEQPLHWTWKTSRKTIRLPKIRHRAPSTFKITIKPMVDQQSTQVKIWA